MLTRVVGDKPFTTKDTAMLGAAYAIPDEGKVFDSIPLESLGICKFEIVQIIIVTKSKVIEVFLFTQFPPRLTHRYTAFVIKLHLPDLIRRAYKLAIVES
jgi:hypothetical protein